MTATEKRTEAVRLIKSIKGRNRYTQGANRDYVFGKPEGASKGYGDCSSTVMHVLRRAAGISIGGNTSAQIDNRGKGIVVEKPSGNYFSEKLLLPGDALYFKGTRRTSGTWDTWRCTSATANAWATGAASALHSRP